MPLKRTPPKTTQEDLQGSSSEPNLNTYETGQENYRSPRPKRMRQDLDPPNKMDSMMAEIKSMFTELKVQQEVKFETLKQAFTEVKAQNLEILKSVEFLAIKYDEVVESMDKIQKENDTNKKYIKLLENRVDQLERQSRSTSIQIRNVPKNKGEMKEDLSNIVKKAGTVLGKSIQDSDIKNIYRVRTREESQNPIIVDFNNSFLRDAIVKSARTYNKENKNNKLSTSLLDVEGPPKPVYVSENLTAKGKRLYFLSREFIKENDYAYCWTYNGQVFLRRREGEPSIRINDEDDLLKLRKQE